MRNLVAFVLPALLLFTLTLQASETQNQGIRVLPAPGPVTVDGKIGDWDLSGGVFACGDVEHLRGQFSVWFHAMYDAENIYLLSRWADPTPLNNPETFGGHGFNGDCLQVRFILFPETTQRTITWWTMWRDAKGVSVLDRASPGKDNGAPENAMENLTRAEERGAKQAFAVLPDNTGYTQEISIPWKLLSPSGEVPPAGSPFKLTIEPNFTAGAFGRITIKDIFDPNVATPDRVFTFRAFKHWGPATNEAKGNVQPQPVHLADDRSFPVTMKDGVPTVDWTGLIRKFEWPGFAPVAFEVPFAGYVSLNILNQDGVTVRHLLNCDQREPGKQTVQWDGLSDATFRTPGQPLPAGEYNWQAIVHPEVKVVFRGYASCGGKAPWIGSPDHFWLGDHGVPSAVVADDERVYLACNGAEGGHHLVATDFKGNRVWSLQNTSGGWDPQHIAADGGAVFVLHPTGDKANKGSIVLSRVDAKLGGYIPWKDRKNHLLTAGDIWEGEPGSLTFSGIAARDGQAYLTSGDRLVVLDGATGKRLRTWPLPKGGALHATARNRVLAICGGNEIVAIDPETGNTATMVKGLQNVRGLTTDKEGSLYVSVGEPDMQVLVFDSQGKETRRIGRKGGHARIGLWQSDGMFNPSGVAVDKEGQLWVMESYEHPKRVSVWNLKDGALVRDFFGPTHYGASGATINPRDPNLLVGEGCEWRLDPQTGKSACLGAFDTQYHDFATYREGSNGKLYLFTNQMRYGTGKVQVWERLGDAQYALRAELHNDRSADKNGGSTEVWLDANGDGKEQPDEVQKQSGALYFSGSNSWSLNLGPDLSLYGLDWKDKRLKVLTPDGFNGCGAPKYDLSKVRTLPEALSAGYERNYSCAVPSADNKRILVNLRVKDHPADFVWHGFDLQSGKVLWTYPNPFFQVHGSHKAPAPEAGLFRGAYGPVGAVTAPGVGDFWLINGNLGEWWALSANGYFLTRVFSGNVFEWKWPDVPAPGVDLFNLPAGSGGEDFGGSATQGKDGKVYIQSGKYGIWDTELTGLEKTVVLPGGKLTINAEDVKKALALREAALQKSAGSRRFAAKKKTVTFTGNVGHDFSDCEIVDYRKSEDASVRTVLAHDDTTLYIGWDVRDSTPWVNGSKDISQMYAAGDTVDLQLGTDPTADSKRDKAARGDLRLSIGNFQGKPTAVLYRFISDEKKPRTFSSGVVQGYQVDWVDVLAEAKVNVKTDRNGYAVEAAVPLAALGITLKPNLALRGDVGATHGDPGGVRTRLRTYWSNQQTGLVDDVVFELQLAPRNWGEIVFE
jgi:DNA-binding beta-propeller fold protein YncE